MDERGQIIDEREVEPKDPGISTSVTTMLDRNLKSGYEYEILLSPKVNGQAGTPVRTDITMEPPNISSGIRSLNKGDTWIQLNWEEPEDYVEKFHVFIAKENEPSTSMRKDIIDPAIDDRGRYITSYNVTDLDPSANYLISIAPSSAGSRRDFASIDHNEIHTCKYSNI